MRTKTQLLQEWIQSRSLREQVFLLLSCCLVIYLFWNLLFAMPINMQQKKLNIAIQAAQADIDKQTAQAQDIITQANQANNAPKLREHAKLEKELQQIREQLSAIIESIGPAQDFNAAINAILNKQPGITFANLRKQNIELYDLSAISVQGIKLSKQSVQLEFNGHYINTLNYLVYLEKLPWHLYWDSIEYRVSEYPNATVLIKLGILSKQRG